MDRRFFFVHLNSAGCATVFRRQLRVRLIITNDPIKWSARSPEEEPKEELRAAIDRKFTDLEAKPLIIILNALRKVRTMCQMCLAHNGKQIEEIV